jgi:hypothetical protein
MSNSMPAHATADALDSVPRTMPPGWGVYGAAPNPHQPFDVAVIMPTVVRPSIIDAVESVYRQQRAGRIQLLIGVDVALGDVSRLHELLLSAPEHVTPCLFYPGYSTSQRHQGLHKARDGGALRTVLSYLAHAPLLAYLDDDNWWAPHHLSQLMQAIQGRPWAFALRWFVHPESRRPIEIDRAESIGPGRGAYNKNFGGWVDPNNLMLDKRQCEAALPWWSIPLPQDGTAMSADRQVFKALCAIGTPGETRQASVFYALQATDVMHPQRVARMGAAYDDAGRRKKREIARTTLLLACHGGNRHRLAAAVKAFAGPLPLDVIVLDYGPADGVPEWRHSGFNHLQVIAVRKDGPINEAEVRNEGARLAITPWLLFLDHDSHPLAALVDWQAQPLQLGRWHRPAGEGGTTLCCARTAFAKAGGFPVSADGSLADSCAGLQQRLLADGEQRVPWPAVPAAHSPRSEIAA